MYELNEQDLNVANGGLLPLKAVIEGFAVGITIGDWIYDNFDEEILDAIEYVDGAI